jgi:methylenetetrahydrofolate reductase (NADPH)
MTRNPRTFSLELFPPQTPEGAEKLRAARARMALLKPSFFSVTFGAGGSTRDRTLDTVLEIQREGHEGGAAPVVHRVDAREHSQHPRTVSRARHPAPRRAARRPAVGDGPAGHLSLRQRTRRIHPCRNRRLVPYRGRRLPGVSPAGEEPDGRPPGFKRKLEAGANSAITQYFYNFDAYAHFIDECQAVGIDGADRSRHHADRQLQQPGALFRQLRRRDTALDQKAARKLRRR